MEGADQRSEEKLESLMGDAAENSLDDPDEQLWPIGNAPLPSLAYSSDMELLGMATVHPIIGVAPD